MTQALSRVKPVECRAAELLRILYPIPNGFGERVYAKSVCERLMERRALDAELMTDRMKDGDAILWRPSKHVATMIRRAVELLTAMGFAVRRSPGVYMITRAGRRECELWFPEMRAIANGRETPGWTPPHSGDTVTM